MFIIMDSVKDLVASSGEESTRFSPLRTCGGHETCEKPERLSLEPVFDLSILGYCRNMADSTEEDLLPLQLLKTNILGDYTLLKTYL